MGGAMLAYVILDGYDLGVGIMFAAASDEEQDQMVASIAPFWDANETWLVLGVGILLVAFPQAHGKILTSLYIPVAIMLTGIILRGVAFDFRSKAEEAYKDNWSSLFFLGSLIAALSQGYVLGSYVTGFSNSPMGAVFSVFCGMFLAAGYCLVGSCWLIMKTSDELQRKAICWAITSLRLTAIGLLVISTATPLTSMRVMDKWFTLPNIIYLSPIPALSVALIYLINKVLHTLPQPKDKNCWVPFIGVIGIFITGFLGLAYSFFPYIVPDKMTIWEAASSVESLEIMLVGVLLVLPCILLYTFFSYRIFWGKARDMKY
jgi:cytochrome d ubiquinol oxidase subunit II